MAQRRDLADLVKVFLSATAPAHRWQARSWWRRFGSSLLAPVLSACPGWGAFKLRRGNMAAWLRAFQARFRAAMKRLPRRYGVKSTDL
jgi:hypothetical protein